MPIRWFYALSCDQPGCDTDAISDQRLGMVHRAAEREGWQQGRCTRGHITGEWYCADHSGQPATACPQAHGYPDQAAWDRRPRARRLR